MGAIIWCEKVPGFEIDGDGVNLTFLSGGERFAYRLARSAFRAFVEQGRLSLNEADREQEARIAGLHGVCPFSAEDRCH